MSGNKCLGSNVSVVLLNVHLTCQRGFSHTSIMELMNTTCHYSNQYCFGEVLAFTVYVHSILMSSCL